MNLCDWCEMPMDNRVDCNCSDCLENEPVKVGNKRVTFCSELCATKFLELMAKIESENAIHPMN